MSDENQLVLPPSFIALFVEPGRIKPSATRQEMLARYDYCEDLAQMLTETASARRGELGITEDDVLERLQRGLADPAAGVTEPEAAWVIRRLAELLGWPDPGAPIDSARVP